MINSAILKAALFCPSPEYAWGLPILIRSKPGCGKTALVKLLAQQMGLPYLRLSPAERGEGYFGCVPVPGTDGHLHYPAPADVVKTFVDRGLLFLDEIDKAAPALQAPLLGCVQLRQLGAHTFPVGVRIIGACNDVDAGGWDLTTPLANRFGHFEYDGMDPQDWTSALLGSFRPQSTEAPLNPALLEEQVRAAWPEADAYARGLVAGFITRRPNLLHTEPVKGAKHLAWPSRRTVEYAAIALASSRVHGLSERDTDEFMAGFVGQSWVAEFRTWTEMADLPAPADVLDGKETFKHDSRRLDRTLAVLGACAALVIPAACPHRKERTEAFWRLVAPVIKDAPDLAVGAGRAVMKNGLILTGESPQTKALQALLPILTAAGMR